MAKDNAQQSTMRIDCFCKRTHRFADLNGALQTTCPCGRILTVLTTPPAPAQRHDDDELCNAKNNPFGSPFSFRRLANEGAFPAFKGPRRKVLAYRRDVLAYIESRQLKPACKPAGELDLNDDDAVFQAGGLRATMPQA